MGPRGPLLQHFAQCRWHLGRGEVRGIENHRVAPGRQRLAQLLRVVATLLERRQQVPLRLGVAGRQKRAEASRITVQLGRHREQPVERRRRRFDPLQGARQRGQLERVFDDAEQIAEQHAGTGGPAAG